MGSHFLPVFRANAEADAEELRAKLRMGRLEGPDLAKLGKAHRVAAIAALLAVADARAFQAGLAASGGALLEWLDRTRGSAVLSHCGALLDALAANHWSLAEQLAARLDGTPWSRDAEYEEDFLHFSLLLSTLLRKDAGREERSKLLGRAADLEGDAIDWRFPLWSALDAGDAAKFEEALEGLMLQARNDFELLRAKDAAPPEELATLACLSIEGIALWRLGTRAGLALQPDYLFVPSLALESPPR
jgi:hypothetical protein